MILSRSPYISIANISRHTVHQQLIYAQCLSDPKNISITNTNKTHFEHEQTRSVKDRPANYFASALGLRGEKHRGRWERVKEEMKIYKEVVVGRNQFMLT